VIIEIEFAPAIEDLLEVLGRDAMHVRSARLFVFGNLAG